MTPVYPSHVKASNTKEKLLLIFIHGSFVFGCRTHVPPRYLIECNGSVLRRTHIHSVVDTRSVVFFFCWKVAPLIRVIVHENIYRYLCTIPFHHHITPPLQSQYTKMCMRKRKTAYFFSTKAKMKANVAASMSKNCMTVENIAPKQSKSEYTKRYVRYNLFSWKYSLPQL